MEEDCNSREEAQKEITNGNFQVAHVVVNKQMMGMVNIQRTFPRKGGRASITLSYGPRRMWSVNQRQVIRGINAGFTEIARNHKFKRVVLSGSRFQQGNRPDVRQIISEENFPRIPFPQHQNAGIFDSEEALVIYEEANEAVSDSPV